MKVFGFIYFESSNAFLSEENKPKKIEKEEGGKAVSGRLTWFALPLVSRSIGTQMMEVQKN